VRQVKAIDLQAKRFKALGHPIRLGMALKLAEEPDTCACDFADVFGVSQPTVSQHLKVLRDSKLVTTRRNGTQICYSLDSAATRELHALLGELKPRRLRRAS
jgi:ArsR family transcriptional regulator